MKKITKKDSSNIAGGDASERRCDRIERRMLKASANLNFRRHRRLSDRLRRLCPNR